MRDERDTLLDLEVPEGLSIIVDELGAEEPAGYRDMPTTGRFVCEWRAPRMGCGLAALAVMAFGFLGFGVMSFFMLFVIDGEVRWYGTGGLVWWAYPLAFGGAGVGFSWMLADALLNRTRISVENGQLVCHAVGPVPVRRHTKSFVIHDAVGFRLVPTPGTWVTVDALMASGEPVRVIGGAPREVVRYVFARLDLLPLLEEEEAKR